MFVRFRERKSDGRQPLFVAAMIMCDGWCKVRRPKDYATTYAPPPPSRQRCRKSSPCRWRIGFVGEDLELMPYRLLVSVAHNQRIAGKVRQQHIADLGSIDGHLLPAFFNGIEPSAAEEIKQARPGYIPEWSIWRGGMEDWHTASVRARV